MYHCSSLGLLIGPAADTTSPKVETPSAPPPLPPTTPDTVAIIRELEAKLAHAYLTVGLVVHDRDAIYGQLLNSQHQALGLLKELEKNERAMRILMGLICG